VGPSRPVAGTHVCLRRVEPERIWELFEAEGITHYCAAPTVQIAIVNEDAAHPLDTPVTAAIAGAPPSPTLLGGLLELNINPMHIYGPHRDVRPDHHERRPPRVGGPRYGGAARLMARQVRATPLRTSCASSTRT
jgi:hypothetical protein